ncbi:hypothetical protein M2451_003460 [Dysgonomonas sp. PFB1-18]|uniref:DUF3408 domain-containing protein n=1 Tax=unclassified Dysgonomonas TaxID=2630389 RepID=UPI002472FDF9|nr:MULTISPECIES: DUF3408 domain-containing protein [unclassified Dysgonomonas]MDH6310621.1 hypothetical protein [Dysgonomonas sp. PF1-14]MDH6340472.1 hypothetical protein [Dysgonomonas sp. PF1-16]MDH6382120.1 hypothetical protein [Dysgonomonas sp. PFB1-18]MDH6399464.1 hypothetical protein [Dysgonomonas sp. PF1-23]
MRQRKSNTLTKEQYTELFCLEKRIRNRRVIYVSEEAYQKLKDTAFLFKFDNYTTTSSLADAILNEHFQTNKDLLNALWQEAGEQFVKDIDSIGSRRSDNEEDNESD